MKSKHRDSGVSFCHVSGAYFSPKDQFCWVLSVVHGHLVGCRASASPVGKQASPQAGGNKWGSPKGQGNIKLLGQNEAWKKQTLKGVPGVAPEGKDTQD